jgi:hypothetical protein
VQGSLFTLLEMADGPYALNEDGTAKDPVAFQKALKSDSEKMVALEEEPESLRIVMGDDMHAFQELIKGVYQVLTRPSILQSTLYSTA